MTGKMTCIAYCFDRHYAPYAAVSACSLLANAASPLRIYWCVPDGDVEAVRARAGQLQVPGGSELVIVPLNAAPFANWVTQNERQSSVNYTLGVFYRLLLPDVLPEDRVIYLDADTLVLRDLGELQATDLQGHLIAGVADRWGGMSTKLKPAEGDVYLNSGVLLMDLAALRAARFLDLCREIYATHTDDITYVDQCIINKAAEGRKLPVAERWNRLTLAGSRIARHLDGMEEAAVLHFYSHIKPWHDQSRPEAAALWKSYADRLGDRPPGA
jgi:lipopolysaccharide biosynthesis glycosyltransferase